MDSDPVLHLIWGKRASKTLVALVSFYMRWCKHCFQIREVLTLFQVVIPREVESL